MLKELPELKNLNIENNNLDIVNLKADMFESKLEKLNVNRIDFEETFESLLKHVKFPELRELNMISCNVDSEFPFFSRPVLLPKIEKLVLDDNDFDYVPWKFEKIESLEFLSLKCNMIGNNKLPLEMGSKLPNLKFLCLTGNYI